MTAPSVARLLRQRLVAVADALSVPCDEGAELLTLLTDVVEHVRARGRLNETWLLAVALTGVFLDASSIRELARGLALARSSSEAVTFVLRATINTSTREGEWTRPIRIVTDTTVIDVDFCARHEHNTGIQRLVRETVTRWVNGGEPVLMAAWAHGGRVMRELDPSEHRRVIAWSDPDRDRTIRSADAALPLIVPWATTVVLMEVPQIAACPGIAGMAELSGNRVDAIGYDTIPLVSADLVTPLESERFAAYLAIIKHAHRVLGISAAAADEFAGFARAIQAQNLPGPKVRSVPLPVDFPYRTKHNGDGLPLLLCVGSHDPRKNHMAVLRAGTRLWSEGISFRLAFLGRGSAASTRIFDREVDRLNKRGFHVETLRSATDADLAQLYEAAVATVFPSLHEGYGLPVAESLATGTPVITTAYGSTAEIARGGGCLLVDPRDEASLVAAMRKVLTDRETVVRLRTEIAERHDATWDDYARNLWSVVIEGAP